MKRRIFDALQRTFLYPHIYFVSSPFKILEYRELVRIGGIQSDDVLLDIGCGRGVQTGLLGRRCRKIVGIDISEGAVGCARSEQHLLREKADVDFRVTSLEDAGFEADGFDKIFSVCVLEHVHNDERLLREAFRVLKPGGALVLSIDSLSLLDDADLRAMHSRKFQVQRYYSPEAIRAKLEQAGFEHITIKPLGRSGWAKKWFAWGIRNDFGFRYSGAVWRYWVLRSAECVCRGDASVYLVIKAYKPARRERSSGTSVRSA